MMESSRLASFYGDTKKTSEFVDKVSSWYARVYDVPCMLQSHLFIGLFSS
jgi:hypothetical protein